ncbi:putative damage-inducible protein DinB [Salirhabdus euzebyi]|uniref:Putative damage-inducible protein DinB n=1 Tax=Salirhabdus euzebyi TaxID=394506 RepID=A0A841Q2G0_9BACI|nr:DinB family protein [Salirhabdus euzebyi]MBB6452515.1 putative damage-inducible protein DinB [Salirhabdus euzebyi]
MNAIEMARLNLEEVRRRSIKVWKAIPEEYLGWKPDSKALTCIEMVRHVLDGEHYYHLALKKKGSLSHYQSPFDSLPLISVEKELAVAAPLRKEFLETVSSFNEDVLFNIMIDRSDVGYVRSLGDMLMRIAYHESVHTGQLLDYLRTAKIPRPDIWD